jgi:hypothetical protein
MSVSMSFSAKSTLATIHVESHSKKSRTILGIQRKRRQELLGVDSSSHDSGELPCRAGLWVDMTTHSQRA